MFQPGQAGAEMLVCMLLSVAAPRDPAPGARGPGGAASAGTAPEPWAEVGADHPKGNTSREPAVCGIAAPGQGAFVPDRGSHDLRGKLH
jgi:hypothetical protein